MKSSNFISYIGQLFNANLSIFLLALTANIAFLFALSPLFISDPAVYWYSPLTGIFLFTFLLSGIHALKMCLRKVDRQHSESYDTKELEYVRPIIVTKFGKQNTANRQFFNTAA